MYARESACTCIPAGKPGHGFSVDTRRNTRMNVEGTWTTAGWNSPSRDFNGPIVPNSISCGDDIPGYIAATYHSHDRVRILMPCFQERATMPNGYGGGHGGEIEARLPPRSTGSHPGFTISQNAPLPFESDGRRKLYDRPPTNAACLRDITNRSELPPRIASRYAKNWNKHTLTFKEIYSTRNYINYDQWLDRLTDNILYCISQCIQLVSHFFVFSQIWFSQI